MKRACVAAVVALAVVSCAALSARAGDERTSRQRVARVRAKLLQPVVMPGIEAGTPLKEMLLFLSERFDLSIVLDVDAFRESGYENVGDESIALPKMQGVRLHTILALALARLHGDYFVQPDGVIYVLPAANALAHQLRQPVQLELDRKPLADAVQELRDRSGFNVVLDSRRAGDKAKTPISVQFNNVSADAAVVILADMAELTPVLIDNVYYITTAENAARLQKEQEERRRTLP